MTTTTFRAPRSRGTSGRSIALVVFTLLLAAFLGLAAAILPWYFMLVFVLIPAVIGFSLAFPVVGIAFTLAVIFQIIPEQYQPRVPFGGGNLRIYDLMLVYLVAIMAVRQIALQKAIFKPLQEFLFPLLYLFACIGISIAYVKLAAPNTRLLSEGRYFIGWTLLPLIALSVKDERWYRWMWRAVGAMAVIMAVYVCLQTFGGLHILSSAKDLAESSTSAEGDAGVVRSAVGGATYIIVLVLLLAINRIVERRWLLLLALPLALLMLAAIGASFGRAVWVATVFGMFVSAYVFRGMKAALVSMLLMAVLVGGMMGVAVVASPKTAQALVDRVARIGTEVERGGSFHWRLQENRDAAESISKHPFFGVGIGADYKGVNRSIGVFAVETVYIHNGYLYFPVKMGLHATLIPFFFIGAAILFTRRAARASPPLDRGRIAALAGTFATMAVVSVNQPEWTAISGIAAFSVVMALMLLERRFALQRAEAAGAAAA